MGAAKRAATDGPMSITDRGRPAFALLKIEDYYRITGKSDRSLLELMDSLPDTTGTVIGFEPHRATIHIKTPEFD